MTASRDSPARTGRRLPSLLDAIPAGTPLSLDDLEVRMQADTERRMLAVLDRVLAERQEPKVPEPPVPE